VALSPANGALTFELPTKRLGFGVPIAILVAGAACAVAAPIRGDSGMYGNAVLLLDVGGFFFCGPNARVPPDGGTRH
jgi:hypothetical protein